MMTNNEKITIIYPPALDYNFMHQRPQQLMKAFAQHGANVIYINPADRYPQVKDVVRPYSDLPNFIVVREGVRFERFLKGKVVVYCPVNQLGFLDRFKHYHLSIFDSCDLATDEFAQWQEIIPALEKRVDFICASAKIIYDDHVSKGLDTILVPNGADYNHFQGAVRRLDKPKDLYISPNKFNIGYYGATYTWLDVEMIYNIAEFYPVTVIGRNNPYTIPINHRNVTVLDMRPYAQLPNYLSWFDVAIIPFKLTEMIKGCDPVKFYEYLSAGKPVVASKMEELQKYDEVTYFANTNNAKNIVSKALRENTVEKVIRRREIAKENSWFSRAETIMKHIRLKLGVR